MTGNNTFGKNERITHRDAIGELFASGRSFQQYPLKVIYMPVESSAGPAVQVLIAVPKKKFKRAVDRNRIRRMIREAYRLNKKGLLDLVGRSGKNLRIGFVFIGNEIPATYAEIEDKLAAAIMKLKHIGTDTEDQF